MTAHEPSKPRAPILMCHACGEGIWTFADLFINGRCGLHLACQERHAGRRRVIPGSVETAQAKKEPERVKRESPGEKGKRLSRDLR